jgi:asparagine synthase (glutamine-hydrolysing)
VSLDYRVKRFLRALDLPPLQRHHAFKAIHAVADQRALLMPELAATVVDPLPPLRPHYEEAAALDPIARLQHVDAMTYLGDDLLVKTDRASMAHGLEVRVPFVDTAVLELAARIPDAAQLRGRQKKLVLREAVRPLLPRAAVDGRKRGFSIPVARWLRRDAATLVDDMLCRRPSRVRATCGRRRSAASLRSTARGGSTAHASSSAW